MATTKFACGRRLARQALAIATWTLAPALTAHAVTTDYWLNSAPNSSWANGANWGTTPTGPTDNTEPNTGDTVDFTFSSVTSYLVNYDVATNTTYGSILLNDTNAMAILELEKLSTTNTLTTNVLTVGSTGKGTFASSGGNVVINGNASDGQLVLGSGNLSSGLFQLTGGNLSVSNGASSIVVGEAGAGSFAQSSSNVTTTGNLTLGLSAGGSGFYTMSNAATTLAVGGNEVIGGAGTGNFTQTAGTHSVAGNMTIGATGNFTISAGSISCPNMINSGNFTQTGGFVGASASNVFTNFASYSGNSTTGSVMNANFINWGTFTVDPAFVFNGGFTNFTTLTIGTGQTFTVHTQPLDNEQQITLSGGTISVDSSLTNNATISANGTIAGIGLFTNNAQFTLTGPLNFNNTAMNVQGFTAPDTNLGNFDISSNQLRLNNSDFDNRASFTMSGGSISGVRQFTNDSAGTLSGSGLISTTFSNFGTVYVPTGTLNISQGFSSSGTIQLGGPAANLLGGNVTNSSNGDVIGNGAIGAPLTNNGSIDPTGGTLILNGLLINNGILTATAGNKLLAKLFVNNPGIISLAGGTFDNGGNALSNTGQISGYGILSTGGLANNGVLTLTGGTTTINGNVTNSAGKLLLVEYNPAIFTGHVTNNGTFKSTSTTVTFAGPYTENGTFLSDPATQTFSDVDIGTTGAWQGGLGDKFIITGQFISHSTANSLWNTDQAELSLQGGAAHILTLNSNPSAGFQNNFAWGTLSLALGDTLSLQNGDAPTDTALFIHDLNLPGGLSQLSAISGQPNQKIFYDSSNPANNFLADQSFTLTGGAQLVPVPEPTTLLLLSAPLLILKRRKQK